MCMHTYAYSHMKYMYFCIYTHMREVVNDMQALNCQVFFSPKRNPMLAELLCEIDQNL